MFAHVCMSFWPMYIVCNKRWLFLSLWKCRLGIRLWIKHIYGGLGALRQLQRSEELKTSFSPSKTKCAFSDSFIHIGRNKRERPYAYLFSVPRQRWQRLRKIFFAKCVLFGLQNHPVRLDSLILVSRTLFFKFRKELFDVLTDYSFFWPTINVNNVNWGLFSLCLLNILKKFLFVGVTSIITQWWHVSWWPNRQVI